MNIIRFYINHSKIKIQNPDFLRSQGFLLMSFQNSTIIIWINEL